MLYVPKVSDASETLGTYSISKLAVLGLVRNYAAELGPFNIRVNAICPGLVKTDFSKLLWENPDAEKATSQRMHPLTCSFFCIRILPKQF